MVEAMTIRLEVEGPVAVATLSRPDKLNALSTQVVAELTTVTERLVADPAVRVLVLAAEGRMFSAGADIDEFRDAFGRGDIDPAGTEAEARAGRRLTSARRRRLGTPHTGGPSRPLTRSKATSTIMSSWPPTSWRRPTSSRRVRTSMP